MLTLIEPTLIRSSGDMPKIILEFIGNVNTDTTRVSVALMSSPSGWCESGQTPEFDELVVVFKGVLTVETKEEVIEVSDGKSIIAPKGKWVQYSSPHPGGAEYVSICTPAFSNDLVHRDHFENMTICNFIM